MKKELIRFEPTEENIQKAYDKFVQPMVEYWTRHYDWSRLPNRVDPELCRQAARFYLDHPLARIYCAWGQLGRSVLSPFGMAGVAGVYPEDVLEEATKPENKGIYQLGYCSTTRLPVLHVVQPNLQKPYPLLPKWSGDFDQYNSHVSKLSYEGVELLPLAELLEHFSGEKWNPEEGEKNVSFSQVKNIVGTKNYFQACQVTPYQYLFLRAGYLLEPAPQ